jgi:branched-subunit amino acid aminotransferase/4-amino-4-deoxychorismate lyase
MLYVTAGNTTDLENSTPIACIYCYSTPKASKISYFRYLSTPKSLTTQLFATMTSMDEVFAAYRNRQSVLEGTFDKNPFARGIAWIEGEYVPLHEARIPLLDQGFMHSDLTYDVPSVWDGRFFRLTDHMTRLQASCSKMRLKLPLPADEVKNILVEMVAKSGIRDAFVELIVTRGLKGVRGHTPGETFKNNLYMFVQPYVWVMEPEIQPVGGKAIIARTVRRISPGSIDPTVKNLQWGDLTRGLFEAADRGAVYPFLTDGDANLTEGSGFNIILVKEGVLYTPDRGVLQGITRRSVFDAAYINGFTVKVEHVPTDLAYRCDEIFMCTTAGGIMPITELDGKPVSDGTIGPITKKIWDTYWKLHYDPAYSFEIDYKSGTAAIANGTAP